MSIPLKQSTAATIKLGPFVDTDGAAVTSLTISQADIRLSKNGGDFTQTNNATGATHDENGFYDVPLDTTDTATLGRLTVAVTESGALPVWAECEVMPANVWDSLYGADALQVDVTQIGGDAQSATDLKDFADAGYDPVTHAITLLGADAIQTGSIRNAAITSAKFATGAIASTTFAAGAIDAAAIASAAITASKFANGAITSSVLAAGCITESKFGAGAITSTVLAASCIGSSQVNATVPRDIADAVLSRDVDAQAAASASPRTLTAIVLQSTDSSFDGETLTVRRESGITFATYTCTTSGENITGITPD